MPLHPILKELGQEVATVKGSSTPSISAVDVLNHLLEKNIVKGDDIRSAVQALSRPPSIDGKKTPNQGSYPTKATTTTAPSPLPTPEKDYRTRHIALKFLYDGANYSGLAQNMGQESDNSVERALFEALTKARLVESRESSGYSRCGRTDRGVSAAGQVVALHLKSAIPLDASMDADGTQLVDDFPSISLPKNEYEKIEAWVVPRKRKSKKQADNDKLERVYKDLAEYPYTKILNNLLPPQIRILGWAPVSGDFSARFSATTRTYRYFFVRRQLDLQLMQSGLQFMVGKHDFRNFCKMDVEKVYNFERAIHDAKIMIQTTGENGNVVACQAESVAEPVSSHQICYVEIHGQAFLWHQIRCIMEVLFMIGNKLEDPEVVPELLNIDKFPGKPAYPLALEQPLVLNDCGYPNLQLGYSVQNVWNVSCQLEQQWEELVLAAARIQNGLATLENVSVVRDDLVEFASAKITERNRKLQKSGFLPVHDETGKSLSQTLSTTDGTIVWKDALKWLHYHFDLVPDTKGLNTAIHIPLQQRSRGTTYEQKVASLQKSDKRRQKYEENVIKKRKTAAEDAAFYSHMIQQGGKGM